MGYLMELGASQATVAAVDWRVFKPIYEAKRRRPLLDNILVKPYEHRTKQPKEKMKLLELLKNVPRNEIKSVIINYVCEEVAKVLGIVSPERINIQEGLFEMGMDSLMAVDLKRRLENCVERRLSSTLTFDYPNVEALSDYLERDILSIAQSEPSKTEAPEEPVGIDEMMARFEILSDEEIDKLFGDKREVDDLIR